MNDGVVSIEKAILCDICLGVPLGWIWSARSDGEMDGVESGGPETILFRGDQLTILKSRYTAGRKDAVDAVNAVLAAADEALLQPIRTVIDKPESPVGGDPHDYRSFAKYWWPNPDTRDGLPWIRRDGEVNPRCYSPDSDYPRLVHFSETVVLLALAAYLAEEKRYRDRALLHLRAWFLDEASRQNPNFRFAQQVPGRDNGRWQAVIEARHLLYVTEAIAILEYIGALPESDSSGLRIWYRGLLAWLRESAQGRRAEEADNNIALWYDLQCMVYGKFCGEHKVFEEVVRNSVLPRLAQQIGPDGSLPHEVARVRSHDYVAFSVAAMVLLSRVAETSDVKPWDIGTGDGRNYQAAHDWLLNVTRMERRLVEPVAHAFGRGDAGPLQALVDVGLTVRGLVRLLKERETLLVRADGRISELASIGETTRAELVGANDSLRLSEQRNEELTAELDELRRKAAQAFEIMTKRQVRLQTYASEIESRYRSVLASRTWRVMAPVREMMRLAKGFLRGKRIPRSSMPKWPASNLKETEHLLTGIIGGAQGLSGHDDVAGGPIYRPSAYLRNDGGETVQDQNAVPAPAAGSIAEIYGQIEAGRAIDEGVLRANYEAGDLARAPDTFVLYRIIGNDLYPRHAKGQSRENVRFILDNEPVLENCEKRWIVNRIVDPAEERSIIDLLDSHGQQYVRIPFDHREYGRIGWDESVLPHPDFLESDRFTRLGPLESNRLISALYRLKNNYVMNNNGARNAALRDGRNRAKWVLPWDGNCFVPASAWRAIRLGVKERPFLKYFVVPMQRMLDNAELLREDFQPYPVEEPQLIFRSDAAESFNESFCYGRRPKVELFWRLGITGKWNSWKDDPWDQARLPLSDEAFQYGATGWVARMFSGVKALEREDSDSFKKRGRVRQSAIISTIDYVDERIARTGSDRLGLVCYSYDALEAARRAFKGGGGDICAGQLGSLVQDAEEALSRGPFSVTHKSTVAPSGDWHDYWHPAPYWWPNPETPDGLPYIKRDGERVPGTGLYEPESEKYDRSRVQRLFDDTTALVLGWFVTGRREFADAAIRNIECWFIDPRTKMNPHMRFAQVRMGRNSNQGYGSGIIELKDLYYFLDAVRILEALGAWRSESSEAFKRWLREYLVWLTESAQGKREGSARNNHGTYYDLQTASIAAYLGEVDMLGDIMCRAISRLEIQFARDGSQPEELARSTTAHYCCFNLQGWMNLALIADRYSIDLWSKTGEDGKSILAGGVRWLLGLAGRPWPYQQLEPFDSTRFDPLQICASFWKPGLQDSNQARMLRQSHRNRFDPHDGIPPYWNLAWPLGDAKPESDACSAQGISFSGELRDDNQEAGAQCHRVMRSDRPSPCDAVAEVR